MGTSVQKPRRPKSPVAQKAPSPEKPRRPKSRDARKAAMPEKPRRPKSRDARKAAPPEKPRCPKSRAALLPALDLLGVSTGDFQEALSAILGADAPNLTPGVISRRTAGWQEDCDRWQHRDLSARRYVVRPLSRTRGVRGLT